MVLVEARLLLNMSISVMATISSCGVEWVSFAMR